MERKNNMNKIDEALEQLISAVLDSPEYRAYDEQRNAVKRFPELKAKIDEFRERNFLIQISDDPDALQKLEQFEQEYSDFRENTMVADFLAAELDFCRMMQDVNLRLTEAMHFE